MTQAIIIHNLLWCEFIFAWIRTKQADLRGKASSPIRLVSNTVITAILQLLLVLAHSWIEFLINRIGLKNHYHFVVHSPRYRHNEKYIMHHKLLIINYTVNPFVIVITRASIIRALKHYELLFYHNVYMYCNICRALFISKLYYWNWLNKRY